MSTHFPDTDMAQYPKAYSWLLPSRFLGKTKFMLEVYEICSAMKISHFALSLFILYRIFYCRVRSYYAAIDTRIPITPHKQFSDLLVCLWAWYGISFFCYLQEVIFWFITDESLTVIRYMLSNSYPLKTHVINFTTSCLVSKPISI